MIIKALKPNANSFNPLHYLYPSMCNEWNINLSFFCIVYPFIIAFWESACNYHVSGNY